MEDQSGTSAKTPAEISTSFESLGLLPRISQAIRASTGSEFPTDIQLNTIPAILSGSRDLLIKTDHGRTFAYIAPIIHLLQDIPLPELSDGSYAMILVFKDRYGIGLCDIVRSMLKKCNYSITTSHLKRGLTGDEHKGVCILIATPLVVLPYFKNAVIKSSNLRRIVFVDAEKFVEVSGKLIQELIDILSKGSISLVERQHIFICSAFNNAVNSFVKKNFNNLLLIGFNGSEQQTFGAEYGTVKGSEHKLLDYKAKNACFVVSENVKLQLRDYNARKASGKRVFDQATVLPPSKSLRITDTESFRPPTVHTSSGNTGAKTDKDVIAELKEGLKLMTRASSRAIKSLEVLEVINNRYASQVEEKDEMIRLQQEKSEEESEKLKQEIATVQAILEQEREEKQELQAMLRKEQLLREELMEHIDSQGIVYRECALFEVQIRHGPLNLTGTF